MYLNLITNILILKDIHSKNIPGNNIVLIKSIY